jgi:hypothetical protein
MNILLYGGFSPSPRIQASHAGHSLINVFHRIELHLSRTWLGNFLMFIGLRFLMLMLKRSVRWMRLRLLPSALAIMFIEYPSLRSMTIAAFSLGMDLMRMVFCGYGCVLVYFFLGFPNRRPSLVLIRFPNRLFIVSTHRPGIVFQKPIGPIVGSRRFDFCTSERKYRKLGLRSFPFV